MHFELKEKEISWNWPGTTSVWKKEEKKRRKKEKYLIEDINM